MSHQEYLYVIDCCTTSLLIVDPENLAQLKFNILHFCSQTLIRYQKRSVGWQKRFSGGPRWIRWTMVELPWSVGRLQFHHSLQPPPWIRFAVSTFLSPSFQSSEYWQTMFYRLSDTKAIYAAVFKRSPLLLCRLYIPLFLLYSTLLGKVMDLSIGQASIKSVYLEFPIRQRLLFFSLSFHISPSSEHCKYRPQTARPHFGDLYKSNRAQSINPLLYKKQCLGPNHTLPNYGRCDTSVWNER